MGVRPKSAPKARLIQKLSPDEASARDEGPRLIPVPEPKVANESLGIGSRYLELADIVLNPTTRKGRA